MQHSRLFVIFEFILVLASSACTTQWQVRGTEDVLEVKEPKGGDETKLSIDPRENDVYVSLSAKYNPPAKGDKTIDLTDVACTRPGVFHKLKEQSAIIYAYIDKQELPIPIFGISTMQVGQQKSCVRKRDEITFIPRLLLPSDGMVVKIDLRHDNQENVTNDEVQEVLSKVVTFASLATNGTISVIPAAKMALERLNPDLTVRFSRENYVATHSFKIPWDQRVNQVRYFRLPLYYVVDDDELLDAGMIEIKVTPRLTRFQGIPLTSSRGTPNYENRYLEDLDNLGNDPANTNAMKVLLLEFRRDTAAITKPAALEERCKKLVTDLNRFELNNYDGAFLLYLALSPLEGFNEKYERTILGCAKRFRLAIENSFPYWKSPDVFLEQNARNQQLQTQASAAKNSLSRLQVALGLPKNKRGNAFKSLFSDELQLENIGHFEFLEDGRIKTLESGPAVNEFFAPFQLGSMACALSLKAKKNTTYPATYDYLVLYQDRDAKFTPEGGRLKFIIDLDRDSSGRTVINGIGFDRVLASDGEVLTELCGEKCPASCKKFIDKLDDGAAPAPADGSKAE